MTTVPIAFAFDENLVMPACVSITSLLVNANKETFYDIYILYPNKKKFNTGPIDKIAVSYSNCRITYRKVDNIFDNAFEIRGITSPAYYRLLIPSLIPEYDKIIYADADIIFRMDLAELYSLNIDDWYIAATKDLGMIWEEGGKKYIAETEGLEQNAYLQSGFILLNLNKIRNDDLMNKFKDLAITQKYTFQDQDILNIVCRGKICFLPPHYNMTTFSYYYATQEKQFYLSQYGEDELEQGLNKSNIHYNGQKPWKGFCVNFDIWWEYYRMSPLFDWEYYYRFFHNKLYEYDMLPLWKRIKILLRYFRVHK